MSRRSPELEASAYDACDTPDIRTGAPPCTKDDFRTPILSRLNIVGKVVFHPRRYVRADISLPRTVRTNSQHAPLPRSAILTVIFSVPSKRGRCASTDMAEDDIGAVGPFDGGGSDEPSV